MATTPELIRRLARRLISASLDDLARDVRGLHAEVQGTKLAVGRLHAQLARQVRGASIASLRDAEFQVFSQFGEDGIIQYLISKLRGIPETFVEFGVEDYTEANTLFLLQNDNWRGLILDGSAGAMASVRERAIYWRHDLTAVDAFIDRDNIDRLLAEHGMRGEIGLLSIDLDGNDYWVWERIDVVRPWVVIAEYNSVFGPHRALSVPYDPTFQRTRAHHSNLYWGCSLKALCHLAARKGYAFVGSNSAGNNAFFVRDDLEHGLPRLTAAEGYVMSKFRESRDASGHLTLMSGAARVDVIADLPVVDVETNERGPVGSMIGGRDV